MLDASNSNQLEKQKMRTRHLIPPRMCRYVIAMTAALVVSGLLHAQQPPKIIATSANDTAMTAAITLQRFTERFVRLITERKGYVTHDRIEAILGITPARRSENTRTAPPLVVDSIGYGYAPEPQWPAGVSLSENNENYRAIFGFSPDGPSSDLYLGLSPDVFGDWRRGHCFVAGDLTQSLLDAGWRSDGKRIGAGPTVDHLFDYFVLGGGHLRMWHYVHRFGNEPDQSCVHQVIVTGKP